MSNVEEFKSRVRAACDEAERAGIPHHDIIMALCDLDCVFAKPRTVMVVTRIARGQTLVEGGPEFWEHRHQMLTDAQAEVKRMAGVEHGGET